MWWMTVEPENVVAVPLEVSNNWCRLPYPRHKKGCPNYLKCRNKRRHRVKLEDAFDLSHPIYLVWVEFDLQEHAWRMKRKHPEWSDTQCRNLLYWQSGVDKRLKKSVHDFIREKRLKKYLPVSEGYGFNVYLTCYKSGLKLDRFNELNTVRKLCFLMHANLSKRQDTHLGHKHNITIQ